MLEVTPIEIKINLSVFQSSIFRILYSLLIFHRLHLLCSGEFQQILPFHMSETMPDFSNPITITLILFEISMYLDFHSRIHVIGFLDGSFHKLPFKQSIVNFSTHLNHGIFQPKYNNNKLYLNFSSCCLDTSEISLNFIPPFC